MAGREREYERLPGRGMRRGSALQVIATFSRLWLGKDHLLLVDSNGFVETYKRFSFRDIQAITLTQTRRRAILNAIFLSCAVFCGLFILLDHAAITVVFGGLLALFVLLAMINSLSAPTCRCHLTTAVQTDELPSLRRLARANRVLSRLRPLIAAAQSEAAEQGKNAPRVSVAVPLTEAQGPSS
jgi:hypothetical protein